MDFIEWGIRTLDNVIKHGLNIKVIFIGFMTLYNVSLVRKMVRRRLPKRFRHEDRLERIERKVDALMSAGGVLCVEKNDLSPNTENRLLKSSQAGGLSARYASVRMLQGLTTFLRGNQTMLKKFTSRKFILAIAGCVVIILNDMLDLNVDKDTVFTFAGILATWIATEGVVDASRKTPEVTDAYTTSKDAGDV